jgi:hypothetical protein
VKNTSSLDHLKILSTLLECEVSLSRDLFATVSDRQLQKKLVGSAAKDVATFFYLLKVNQIDTPDLIVEAALAHNDKIDAIFNDEMYLNILGRTKTQIIGSKFTERGLVKLADNFRSTRRSIDQSDISRFLILQMSQESCRSVIEMFEQAGMLERSKVLSGSTLVMSNGVVETIIEKYLENLDSKLEGLYR